MNRKYRIIYKKGRYYPQYRKFFIWWFINVDIDGYQIAKNFSSYKQAMGYIYVYHQMNYHNRKYMIVR